GRDVLVAHALRDEFGDLGFPPGQRGVGGRTRRGRYALRRAGLEWFPETAADGLFGGERHAALQRRLVLLVAQRGAGGELAGLAVAGEVLELGQRGAESVPDVAGGAEE